MSPVQRLSQIVGRVRGGSDQDAADNSDESSAAMAGRLRTGASALVAAQMVSILMALALNFVAARALGPGLRGEVAFTLALSLLIAILFLAGFDKAIPVVLPLSSVGESFGAVRSELFVRSKYLLAIGLVSSAALLAFGSDNWLYPAAVVFMASTFVFFVAVKSATIASSVVPMFTRMSIYISVATLAVAFVLFVAGIKSPKAWLSAYALGQAFGLAVLWRALPAIDPVVPAETTRRIRKTGLELLPASLSNFAALRSERLLLPILSDTAELGIYVIAATFADMVSYPAIAIGNVITPQWRKQYENGTFRPWPTIAVIAAATCVVAPISAIVGAVLIEPVFGADFAPARKMLPLLAAGSAVFVMNNVLASRLTVIDATKRVGFAETMGMICAICGYFLFIPSRGGQGAALGALIGYSVSTIILLWPHRATGGDSPESLRFGGKAASD